MNKNYIYIKIKKIMKMKKITKTENAQKCKTIIASNKIKQLFILYRCAFKHNISYSSFIKMKDELL